MLVSDPNTARGPRVRMFGGILLSLLAFASPCCVFECPSFVLWCVVLPFPKNVLASSYLVSTVCCVGALRSWAVLVLYLVSTVWCVVLW